MGLGEVTLLQYAMVAATAFVAGIIGGIAGYGSGVLMLAVLVPLLGPQVAIPIVSAAALMNNATRLWVFWKDFDRVKARIVVIWAVPTTALGAWGFTRLTGAAALLLVGSMLVILVPLRRYMTRLEWRLDHKQLAATSVGYGLLTGGTSGAGVLLISMLMWAGLTGPAVIATDAAITMVLVTIKAGTFQTVGALPLSSWIMAGLIGLSGTPGTLVAKRLAQHLSLKQHTAILDGVVIFAGLMMILQAVM